uniref:DRY_EERY domain-containing protein n=1 Tax=Syphacia muris TaxID=451379 RepID=A0A158R5H8_9BILA
MFDFLLLESSKAFDTILLVGYEKKMWHEARRQEKLIRSQMIDSVKRNERRKLFYENVRKDPEQFMQIHGRKCQIHVDPSVARAAEASSILRKWQGDPKILIDRFDARAHLDFIMETNNSGVDQRNSPDVEELQCEYERYRILILNEFEKVSERSFLKNICEKEFWPSDAASTAINKTELEKKKQLKDKKAAVGFSYEDTPTVMGRLETSDDSDDDEELEPDEFDLKFDINSLDAEKKRQLNKLGINYGISSGAFSSLLQMDRREQDETHQLKEIEKAKHALAGRQAKAERALLKKKRALIVGKGCLNEEATTTLLSFVAQNKKEYVESSSSSQSEDDEETTEFITTFGGEDEKKDKQGDEEDEDEGTTAFHGPVLPSAEFRRLFELKTRRSSSPEDFGGAAPIVNRSRYRSRSPNWRGRSRSIERSFRRKSRSRDRDNSRTRSRPRSRSRDRGRSGACSNRDQNSRRERSHSRERRRSYDRNRERTRRSRSPSLNSKKRKAQDLDSAKRRRSESKEKKRRRRHSSSESDYRRSTSPSKGTGSVLSPSRSNGDMSPLEIRSSMSESEKERIEVENRRRRIRRTAKLHRLQHGGRQSRSPNDEENEKKAVLAHKLRVQMQKALKKTAEELKEEERIKHEEQLRERRVIFVYFFEQLRIFKLF